MSCIAKLNYSRRRLIRIIEILIFTLIFINLPFLNNNAFSMDLNDSPQGWHWYNEQPDIVKKKKDISNQSNITQQSALAQLHAVQHAFNEAKAQAVLYPTEENIYHYLQLQNAITEQSTQFAKMWPKVLLDHPELDYSIDHPSSQLAVQAQNDKNEARKIAAVKALSQQYGLVFFYRGNEASDEVMAKTIKAFSTQYGIALIAISMDQTISPDLPNSQSNTGQAQAMGIKYFPALVLVNPKEGVVKPLAYGFMAEDMLLNRFLDVAHDFQENW